MFSWVCHHCLVSNPEPDTAQGITYWGRPHRQADSREIYLTWKHHLLSLLFKVFQGPLLPLGSTETLKPGFQNAAQQAPVHLLIPVPCEAGSTPGTCSICSHPQAFSHRVPFTWCCFNSFHPISKKTWHIFLEHKSALWAGLVPAQSCCPRPTRQVCPGWKSPGHREKKPNHGCQSLHTHMWEDTELAYVPPRMARRDFWASKWGKAPHPTLGRNQQRVHKASVHRGFLGHVTCPRAGQWLPVSISVLPVTS